MSPRRFFAAVSLISLVNLVAVMTFVTAQEDNPPLPHWDYAGEAGPENWGDLSPDFAACSTGEAQSPIDLADAQTLDLVNIEFHYQPSALNILNNGHTIQANYDTGSYIIYNEQRYDLLQFHFHHPSEHSIAGEPFPMEVHFVHRNEDGNLAVVGAMLFAGAADNAAFAPVWEHAPTEAADVETIEGVTVDANAMLPENRLFYTYNGSLTTPPCSERVRWLVLTTLVELSEAQVDAFAEIFEMNARPVQPLNDRDLLQDTAGA
jgi:carbonic anhydrase